jgi:RND family efflux transporter MFP subunit
MQLKAHRMGHCQPASAAQWARRSATAGVLLVAIVWLGGCSNNPSVRASDAGQAAPAMTVGVAPVTRKPISNQLTVSSELVPDQEIDVYAKESGYVKKLNVDYGSRVKEGDVMAELEIPELQAQLDQDAAAIRSAADQVTHANHELKRLEAQHDVLDLQYKRLKSVAEARPGLVAQQEVDDAHGKDLAADAQVEAGKAATQTAQSQLDVAKAREQHDKVLYAYSRITAPFAGVVTQRYANYGTLMQAGTGSSTQALPLVRLSKDDKFRLVIPVPESYVKSIHVGDPVQVKVPSLDKVLPAKVARFSVDVSADTRTMHTEVDVPNPSHNLIQGVYAEATLMLERKNNALVVPLQAVNHSGNEATVFLVDVNNILQQRKIHVGMQTASDAEVLSGLNEGDRVVVSDTSGLKVGTEVRPQEIATMQSQAQKEQ